ASKAGTGFADAALGHIEATLEPLRRATSPFEVGTPAGRGHHWVEPRLVCEVRFTEWTKDGGIRHPAFLGLREDKRPEDCRREVPTPGPPERGHPSSTTPALSGRGQPGRQEPQATRRSRGSGSAAPAPAASTQALAAVGGPVPPA